MFHPDNIKNFHGQGGKVAISLYQLLKVHGGAGGVARKLNSHVKVSIDYHLTSNLERNRRFRARYLKKSGKVSINYNLINYCLGMDPIGRDYPRLEPYVNLSLKISKIESSRFY
jgi:hypothetical protein